MSEADRQRRAAEEKVNGRWDSLAEANWRRLADDERESWCDLVRERLPELACRRRWVEGLAKGWAFDPSMVANLPPRRNALGGAGWARSRPAPPAPRPEPEPEEADSPALVS